MGQKGFPLCPTASILPTVLQPLTAGITLVVVGHYLHPLPTDGADLPNGSFLNIVIELPSFIGIVVHVVIVTEVVVVVVHLKSIRVFFNLSTVLLFLVEGYSS